MDILGKPIFEKIIKRKKHVPILFEKMEYTVYSTSGIDSNKTLVICSFEEDPPECYCIESKFLTLKLLSLMCESVDNLVTVLDGKISDIGRDYMPEKLNPLIGKLIKYENQEISATKKYERIIYIAPK